MKNSNVLYLATAAAAVSIGLGAFYLRTPTEVATKAPVQESKVSEFRSSMAARDKARAAQEQAQAKPAVKAQAPLFFALAQRLPVPLANPVPAGVDAKSLPREKKVLSTSVHSQFGDPQEGAGYRSAFAGRTVLRCPGKFGKISQGWRSSPCRWLAAARR